ncbi:MAG: hypothetical protein AAF702_02420 [Chloroflexota bacterium]
MLPQRHLLLASVVGLGGWLATRDYRALPLSIAAGTLPDLDHGADYAWYAFFQEHRLLLPLHGYEWAIPLWFFGRRRWGWRLATVITVSYLIHLLADQYENQTRPPGYFFFYRMSKRFLLSEISLNPVDGANGRLEDMEKLKSLVRRLGLNW